MLKIGENTGNLDTALLNVSYFYNREVKESIGKMQAMIEPALTLVLGALLGWVMVSVLGPVYDTHQQDEILRRLDMSDRRVLYFLCKRPSAIPLGEAATSSTRAVTRRMTRASMNSEFSPNSTRSRFTTSSPTLPGRIFHDEMIPWLRGSDRQAVIERRLAQRYRDTRLAASFRSGPLPSPGNAATSACC